MKPLIVSMSSDLLCDTCQSISCSDRARDFSWEMSASLGWIKGFWRRSWHLFISFLHEAMISEMTVLQGKAAIKCSKE